MPSGAPTRIGSLRNQSSGRPLVPNGATAGFSLIEVLAALLVTMLLVLTFTPFVGQMLATWTRGGEAADLVEIESRGVGRLRTDLRHAIVWAGYGQLQYLPAFRGDETSMSFPAVVGLQSGEAGIEYLSFTVASSINGRALVRRRAPVIGSSYGGFVDPVVLVSGPYRYLFKYYSREGKQMPAWSKGRFGLPARVELDIADRNARLLVQMPITIPIFASLSAGCFAVSGLQGCPVTAPPPVDMSMLPPGLDNLSFLYQAKP